MESYQRGILLFYGLFSFLAFWKGLYECKGKKNVYGNAHIFNLIGAFTWGDTVVFGLFWTAIALVSLILGDWILFLLTLSLFWVVRSLGEVIYWFGQQFSPINRNPPMNFRIFKIFQNDSVWFVFQIFWQCATVVALLFSLYFAKLWLEVRF